MVITFRKSDLSMKSNTTQLHNAFVLIRCTKQSHKNCKPVRNALMKNFNNILQSYTTNSEVEGIEYCVVGKAIVKGNEIKPFQNKLKKLEAGTASRPVGVAELKVLISNWFNLLSWDFLEIILRTNKTFQKSVIGKINRNKRTYSHIKKITPHYDPLKNSFYVILNHNKLTVEKEEEAKFIKKYLKLDHVSNVSIVQTVPSKFKNTIRGNTDCHFFFDIDSTLTPGQPGIPGKKVKTIFENLKKQEFWIHFASGRRDGDVQDYIVDYDTEPQAIAENGGLIILSKTLMDYNGNINKPDEAFKKLKKKFGSKIHQDTSQGSRVTERIIKNNISQDDCKNCVKNLGVKLLASKTAYHIVEKHVDKGTAIRKLAKIRKWGDDVLIIGVGDSELDVPMFKESNFSFAVNNASNKCKDAASETLSNSFLEGIEEMYETWFKI